MERAWSDNAHNRVRGPARVLIWAVAGVLLLGAAYYVYVGSKAFRRELADFAPTPDDSAPLRQRNAEAMLEIAEPVYWTLSDGSRQRAFYRPSRNGALIVYAHGAPGAGAGFHPYVRELAARGYGALALDLPGYGASEGARAWDDRFAESLRKAVDFAVAEGVEPGRIGGFGYSMGVYSIARAAAEDSRIGALTLQAGFTNMHDQLLRQFRWRVPGVGYFAVAAAYLKGVDVLEKDTEAALARVGDRPVMVINGTEDYAIPLSMGEALVDVAANGRLWIIEGAGHGDFADAFGSGFYQELDGFWRANLLAAMPAAAGVGHVSTIEGRSN